MTKTDKSPTIINALGVPAFTDLLGATSLDIGGVEVLRFEDGGKIFVRGEEVDNNKEVYRAFQQWLYSDKTKEN